MSTIEIVEAQALVDADLRDAGLDPVAIAKWGDEFIQKLRKDGLL